MLGDRHALDERGAEVDARQTGQVVGVLDGERPVEAELVAQQLDVLARRAFRHQQEGRVAREVHDDEDDRDTPRIETRAWRARLTQEAGHARPLATSTSSRSRRTPRSPSASRRARAGAVDREVLVEPDARHVLLEDLEGLAVVLEPLRRRRASRAPASTAFVEGRVRVLRPDAGAVEQREDHAVRVLAGAGPAPDRDLPASSRLALAAACRKVGWSRHRRSSP